MPEAHPASAAAWIDQLALAPHPEGGWYRELHRSTEGVHRDGDAAPRCGLTLIAYLLEAGARSRWHRVRGSDEIWQHGAGAPLELWRLPPDGGEAQRLILGPWSGGMAAAAPGERESADPQPVRVIAADWWQAARSLGAWSLVTCCVGPGFDFADFELLRDRPLASPLPGADPLWL
jgi:predicted cupin superfamily sugar epimerase